MMPGVESWGLENEQKPAGKVHELPLKELWGEPMTLANNVSLKEFYNTNRDQKALGRAVKYSLRLLEIEESNPIGDTLENQWKRVVQNYTGIRNALR
jgi:hypothetical protein